MLGGRGAVTAGPAGARYRCLPCQAFVVATALGHCPRCGTPAPRISLLASDPPPPRRRIDGDLRTLIRIVIGMAAVLLVATLVRWLFG